ncbi:sigma-70 family RNA polymerase sigma factor [Phocaeicola vulgatus]|nr:sigma-70 family RNA polymerase sigma factor [Phocaeicola vulgatus]
MEQTIEDSFEQARILTAIDNLPERCKNALLLSKRDGLKYEEIAENMSVSVNTVRNHISKALRLIKKVRVRYICFL